jgi:hypothetical protein
MYGLKTIRQINAENAEAQRIMEKHATQGQPTHAQPRREEVAKQTMERILSGAKG